MTKEPPSSPFKARVLSPHEFSITASGNLKHFRTIAVREEIRSAECCRCGIGRRRFYVVYVGLKEDQSALVYSAKSGAFLWRQTDPLKDPVFQTKIAAYNEKKDSPVRYAVVQEGGSVRSNSFYNVSTGFLEDNLLPEGMIFKDREVAEAAAKALTRMMGREEYNILLCPGRRPRPFRAVPFLRTRNGFKFLEKVRGRNGEYFPVIPRPRQLPVPGSPKDARG